MNISVSMCSFYLSVSIDIFPRAFHLVSFLLAIYYFVIFYCFFLFSFDTLTKFRCRLFDVFFFRYFYFAFSYTLEAKREKTDLCFYFYLLFLFYFECKNVHNKFTLTCEHQTNRAHSTTIWIGVKSRYAKNAFIFLFSFLFFSFTIFSSPVFNKMNEMNGVDSQQKWNNFSDAVKGNESIIIKVNFFSFSFLLIFPPVFVLSELPLHFVLKLNRFTVYACENCSVRSFARIFSFLFCTCFSSFCHSTGYVSMWLRIFFSSFIRFHYYIDAMRVSMRSNRSDRYRYL